MKPTQEIMGWESSDVVRFDLGPRLQGQTRIATLKRAYNSLIIGPRGKCETNLYYTITDKKKSTLKASGIGR